MGNDKWGAQDTAPKRSIAKGTSIGPREKGPIVPIVDDDTSSFDADGMYIPQNERKKKRPTGVVIKGNTYEYHR